MTIEAALESIATQLEVIANHLTSKEIAGVKKIDEEPQVSQAVEEKKVEQPKHAPVPPLPVKEEKPKPAPPAEPAEPAKPAVTVEQINAELIAAWTRNGEDRTKIDELLTSFGISKLSDLDEGRYNELFEKVKQL